MALSVGHVTYSTDSVLGYNAEVQYARLPYNVLYHTTLATYLKIDRSKYLAARLACLGI